MCYIRVFVYGTLKHNQPNNSCLDGAIYEGKAEIDADRFIMVDCGAYPALILNKEGPIIKGETYLVNEGVLKNLDWLEGYPGLYKRDTFLVHREDGSSVEALVYYMTDDQAVQATQIYGGEW